VTVAIQYVSELSLHTHNGASNKITVTHNALIVVGFRPRKQTKKKKKKPRVQSGLKPISARQKVTDFLISSYFYICCSLYRSHCEITIFSGSFSCTTKKKKKKRKMYTFLAVVAAMLGAAAASSHSESPGAAKGPRVRSGVN
jgi:hypothetical protein